MPFDPYLLEQFEHIRRFASFDEAFSSPEGGMQFGKWSQNPGPWDRPEDVETENRTISGPHGEIAIRIYRPIAPSAATHPALLWMHGGAFMFGDLEMNESNMVSAELAHRAHAVVVAVDYRLAVGGVTHPVPLDDVVAAWRWLAANTAELGIDADRLSIGGASAGGNLAASASMRLRDEGEVIPRSMLLAYPLVHFPLPALPASVVHEMAVMPSMLHFDTEFTISNLQAHLGRITDFPAGIAPGNFPLEGMPAAFIAPAEYDELRPSGELFARQLESVGIPVAVQLAEGQVHGHLDRNPTLPAVEKTLQFFAEALS